MEKSSTEKRSHPCCANSTLCYRKDTAAVHHLYPLFALSLALSLLSHLPTCSLSLCRSLSLLADRRCPPHQAQKNQMMMVMVVVYYSTTTVLLLLLILRLTVDFVQEKIPVRASYRNKGRNLCPASVTDLRLFCFPCRCGLVTARGSPSIRWLPRTTYCCCAPTEPCLRLLLLALVLILCKCPLAERKIALHLSVASCVQCHQTDHYVRKCKECGMLHIKPQRLLYFRTSFRAYLRKIPRVRIYVRINMNGNISVVFVLYLD